MLCTFACNSTESQVANTDKKQEEPSLTFIIHSSSGRCNYELRLNQVGKGEMTSMEYNIFDELMVKRVKPIEILGEGGNKAMRKIFADLEGLERQKGKLWLGCMELHCHL